MHLSAPTKPANLDAPGLRWRTRNNGWVAYWICRQDIAKRGFPIKVRELWRGDQPTADEWLAIASQCITLQDEMLTWGKGDVIENPVARFDDTLRSLIEVYQLDKDSPYQELRYFARKSYESKLRTLAACVGGARISALTFRDFKRWHEGFRAPAIDGGAKRVSRAHGLMTMVRLVIGFGALLKLPGCKEARATLADMEFENPKRRAEYITAEQANAIRAEAHRCGLPSIALAQAIQFELMVRQKDVIGEWLPMSEPGVSAIHWAGKKWLCGMTWNEIDTDLTLTHRISKSIHGRNAVSDSGAGKVKSWRLSLYPMIVEELAKIPPDRRVGPMIVAEHNGRPWRKNQFAEAWREIATAVGVPTTVQNRDSRAGGATEADDAGADVETTRKALGHSRPETTRIYTRNEQRATDNIAVIRTKSRPRTE